MIYGALWEPGDVIVIDCKSFMVTKVAVYNKDQYTMLKPADLCSKCGGVKGATSKVHGCHCKAGKP